MTGRKIRRRKEKEAKKRLAKEVKQKMNLFDKIGEECLACRTSFDRTNREMVSTWSVVVRQDEEKVNLYCPTCWSAAKQFVQEIQNVE